MKRRKRQTSRLTSSSCALPPPPPLTVPASLAPPAAILTLETLSLLPKGDGAAAGSSLMDVRETEAEWDWEKDGR
jgi:hypothetical protein